MNLDNLQRAVFSQLTGNAAVMALVVGVYADRLQAGDSESNDAFPYITIGDDRAQSSDTKTDFGADVVVQIDIWSRSGNYLEAKAIGKAAWRVLHHQPMVIDDADHTMTVAQSEDYFRDTDGVTRHGVVQVLVKYSNIV